jgi:hypothetical protein
MSQITRKQGKTGNVPSQVFDIPKGQKLLDSPTLSILFDGGLDVNTVKPVFLGQKKCI